MTGCDRSTIYRYAKEDPSIMQAIEEANEVNLDAGEATLIDFVRGHHIVEIDGQRSVVPLDPRTHLDALKFYLRTKGRRRGYGDRMEHSGPDEVSPRPIQVRIVNEPRDQGS